MSHTIFLFCIYIYEKLLTLGEDPISGNKDASTSISPNFREMGVNSSLYQEYIEDYLINKAENQARLMKLRMRLNIGSDDTCEEIKQKFESNIKNKKLKFTYLTPSGFVKNKNGDCYWLKLKVPEREKKEITDKENYVDGKLRLTKIYGLLNCSFDGNDNRDFGRLFSIFSEYKDGFIWLDLSGITQLNHDVVTNDSPDDFNKRV